MKVRICDSMMGTGKSSAAINYMNEHLEKRFIYITPYIKEADRISSACRIRNFCRPVPKSEGGRLEDLHRLVANKENIASTHALFARYTQETMNLISENGYTLVMDEVFCVMEDIKIKLADVKVLFDANYVKLDGDKVVWLKPEYDGYNFSRIKDMAEQGVLYFHNNKFMFWNFPIEVFTSFQEIFVLTYMFKAQMQRYYFDMHGIGYDYIYTAFDGKNYTFSDVPSVCVDGKKIKSLIKIIDDDKLNSIGDGRFDLSFSWWDEATSKQFDRMRKNLNNYFKNILKSRVDDRMWTTYKDSKKKLSSAGGADSFLSFNIRATNEHRHRFAIAYLTNVHLVPHFKNYFKAHGVTMDEDMYALSEMIQWIWRSAIRDEKPITLYVPSKRMREMFINWLDELAEGKIQGEK